MTRYIVLTGRDCFETLYWSVYDRVAGVTLHHRPNNGDEAQRIADRLNGA